MEDTAEATDTLGLMDMDTVEDMVIAQEMDSRTRSWELQLRDNMVSLLNNNNNNNNSRVTTNELI